VHVPNWDFSAEQLAQFLINALIFHLGTGTILSGSPNTFVCGYSVLDSTGPSKRADRKTDHTFPASMGLSIKPLRIDGYSALQIRGIESG